MGIIFCTLGPEGTCHDNAVKNFAKYNNITEYCIEYVNNFTEAAELMKNSKVDFIIQNCAHPQVYELNERYRREIFVVDSFIFPTKEMGILKRKDSNGDKTLGLMPATKGYINLNEWDNLIYETANPIVGQNLIRGKYNFGITFIEYTKTHSNILEVYEDFGGPVDTAWIVYGKERKFQREAIRSRLFIKESE